MYRGWTQTEYQNKHYNINQKDEGTQDDRERDGGTNFILRIKEQEKHLILHEHDYDDQLILLLFIGLFYGLTIYVLQFISSISPPLSICFCPAILTPIRKLVPPSPNTVSTFSCYSLFKEASNFSKYMFEHSQLALHNNTMQFIPRSSIRILTCYSFTFFLQRTSILKANVWPSLDVCTCYV